MQAVAEVPLTRETFPPSVQNHRTRCGSSIVENIWISSSHHFDAKSTEFLQWSFVMRYCTASFPRHLIAVLRPSILRFQTF